MELILTAMIIFAEALIFGVALGVTIVVLTYYVIQKHIRKASRKIAAIERV